MRKYYNGRMNPTPSPKPASKSASGSKRANSPSAGAENRYQKERHSHSSAQNLAQAGIDAGQHMAKMGIGASKSLINIIVGIIKPPRYDDPRLDYFNTRADFPLALAAIVFLAAYSLPIIYPDMNPDYVYWCFWVQSFVWGLFILQYVFSLVIAKHKWSFIRYHLFDLALVLLPFLGPLRMLRLLFLLEVLQRHFRHSMRGKLALYATVGSAIVIFMGALAELQVERGVPHSGFNNFGTALWWSIVTVTTVGYGDIVPVTPQGRVVAGFLMLGGVTLMGTVTAVITSWLADSIGSERQILAKRRDKQKLRSLQEILNEVGELHEKINSLNQQVEHLTELHAASLKALGQAQVGAQSVGVGSALDSPANSATPATPASPYTPISAGEAERS